MSKFNKGIYGYYSMYSWMFEYMDKQFGKDVLKKYWKYLGSQYYSKLVDEIKKNGLVALENYYIDALEGEENKEDIEVFRDESIFKIKISNCKAIEWLKKVENDRNSFYHRPYFRDYCDHCKVINEVIAEKSGLKFVIEFDKEGCCLQTYRKVR